MTTPTSCHLILSPQLTSEHRNRLSNFLDPTEFSHPPVLSTATCCDHARATNCVSHHVCPGTFSTPRFSITKEEKI